VFIAEGQGKCNRKIPPQKGKGEMAGECKFLNVRAHQQPGDRLARQTPPGARPNKREGLVPVHLTLG